jgi:formate dehydrogenase subunit beta
MNRLEPLKRAIEEILDEVDGVVALKNSSGHVAPHLFQDRAELDELAVAPKYPLPGTLHLIQKAHPEAKLAIVCRGCEERGLIELAKRNQVNLDQVTVIGLACTPEEAEECRCAKPYPSVLTDSHVGERTEPVADKLVEELRQKDVAERLGFWRQQFDRCIKCYACRNACPQCFCPECALEEDLWVERGEVPPAYPTFHLIRAMHTAGKCVGCRECELACPAGIPLTTLYALIREDVKDMFGYEPGVSLEDQPPLVLTMEVES